MEQEITHWEWEIKKETSWLGTSLKELRSYKELLLRLVRKEFLATYQQTLLGPLWVIIIPVFTVLTYVLVFNKVMGFTTQGVPPLLYYLAGITLWNLFSDTFLAVVPTFSQNAQIFTKVYFPRLIVPLSVIALQLVRFSIQLVLLIIITGYYVFVGKATVTLTGFLYAIPAIIITVGTAFGSGLIFSILTTKYRDLQALLQFILRLFMFLCPIFFSYQTASQKFKWLVALNPLSILFEFFRFAFTGKGYISGPEIIYSIIVMLIVVVAGLLLFNKTGDKLIDFI